MQVFSPPEDHTPEYASERLAIVGDLVLAEKTYCETSDLHKVGIAETKQDPENNKVMKRAADKFGIFSYAFNDSDFYDTIPARHRLPCSAHTPFIESIICAVFMDGGYRKPRS